MKTGLTVQATLVLAAMVATAQNGNGERAALIDKMHAYYVKQFDDLRMTKEGYFGVSRIEMSKIKAHARDGGDPGFQSKEWFNTVEIYGCHGKPLVAGKTERRYSRVPNQLPKGYVEAEIVPKNPADAQQLPKVKAGLIESAVRHWASGKFAPVGTQFQHVYIQVRPIRLDKKECLPCHTGMKLNQPVAAMVYTVARRSVARG